MDKKSCGEGEAQVNGQHTGFQTQLPWVQFPAFPKKFKWKKISKIVEVDQKRRLEGSGQWLENVDQNHLVLASGKQTKK